MGRPCECDKGITISAGKVSAWVDGAGICPPCWSWHARPAARRFHGGDAKDCLPVVGAKVKPVLVSLAPKQPLRRPLPCVHLGSQIGSVACPSCRGTVQLKTFACTVHGTATIAKKVVGVAGCCRGCESYSANPPA